MQCAEVNLGMPRFCRRFAHDYRVAHVHRQRRP
jgi:hypothetical protein